MMDGIWNWYLEQTKAKLVHVSEQEQRAILSKAKANFDKLTKAINITNIDEEMKRDGDSELNLYNPYSKVTCFILYLYSMELGDPPLYAELNRVARDRDLSQLKNLGPIQKAMGKITWVAENRRNADDKIKTGS